MRGIRHGFTLRKNKGVRYLTIPAFEQAGGIVCAFSTRVGGVSESPYDTLNFSQKREQSKQNFLENIQRFGRAAGFEYQHAAAINYGHTDVLYRARQRDAGAGIVSDIIPTTCDGLYTDTVRLPLITYHADCVPLFFYDPKRRSAAICHAGWRGVASHIAKNAVASLEALGSSHRDILAAVGPCISVKHFEVQQDVFDVFNRQFGGEPIERRDGKIYIDLVKANVLDLENSGITLEHITVSDLCTYENRYLFFSHRRDKGRTGAMAAVIELIEK